MNLFFKYNWQVRDEWFALLRQIPYEELIRERTGGMRSFLKTLFHIVDVEYSWIQAIKGEPVLDPEYQEGMALESVQRLSEEYRLNIRDFLDHWTSDREYQEITVPWNHQTFYAGEIIRHIIAHEIHHIGQLSVWAREVGLTPVSANFIGNGFMKS